MYFISLLITGLSAYGSIASCWFAPNTFLINSISRKHEESTDERNGPMIWAEYCLEASSSSCMEVVVTFESFEINGIPRAGLVGAIFMELNCFFLLLLLAS